jgi:hypothetical protein
MNRMACLVLLSVTVVGCCQNLGKKDEDPGPISITPPADPPKPATTLTAPVQPNPLPTPTTASGAYAADGLPVDIPASRSAVPTLSEWSSVPREISVARSTPLNCETKMLREWLRVSCHPKSSTGGTPTTVVHRSGPKDDSYYFAKGGTTSLVTTVTRGKHAESSFSWTDKTQTLVIDWPNGVPRPVIKFTD